ncbi:hypothetical protein A4D02_26190 [Niastella koreensis]|uniref:Tetratricopeptide repeat protein n=2 Tax=Niastella koreensis TaxID=354356 RepID=G8TKU6_NIAKG|nr:hypothetical protein [Niastella koreensis]AEV99775.1 hypothetical protein Niako_3471 [Niastella koreensis GR20-10]OQP51605.1 hypothetical protein A4D02_26190 [Niastella koreensis]
MRSVVTLFILTLTAVRSFANVDYIDISKISNDNKLISAFNFIKNNRNYYETWTNEWKYDKPKQGLVTQLREHYNSFSALTTKNEETFLLLGDIAHYLYNLDDTAYYDIAVKNFEEAVKRNSTDYRPHWFLGNHYALANALQLGIDNFVKAKKLLPAEQPADFWNDYALAAAIANMPSNCIYAMDKVKKISGKEGSFQQQLGETIYKRIVPVDKNNAYAKEDIWAATREELATFTCRPLGIKVMIDSTWGLTINDYKKNQEAFIIKPSTLKNKEGREIHYTIAILMKTANDNDKLNDYINNFVSKYKDKSSISFSTKYDKMVAYEIKDKTMYPEVGGAHMYILGIERNAPQYPGLLIESAGAFPEGNTGEVSYYQANDCKDRFKGKIFYAILLDTCEDIHAQSYSIFKSLFDNQIIIE